MLNNPIIGGALDTSDATATANDILSPKTAYAKGKKITGSIQTFSSETVLSVLEGTTINIPKGFYDGNAKVNSPYVFSNTFSNVHLVYRLAGIESYFCLPTASGELDNANMKCTEINPWVYQSSAADGSTDIEIVVGETVLICMNQSSNTAKSLKCTASPAASATISADFNNSVCTVNLNPGYSAITLTCTIS